MRSEKGLSLSDLPVEVIENVIKFLDGPSLKVFGRVSPLLNSIVNKPNTSIMKVWKRVCFEEVSRDSLLETLALVEPRYWAQESKLAWNVVYSIVKRWEALPSASDLSANSLGVFQYEITSLFVSGPWLVVGTQNRGTVVAHNMGTGQRVLLYKGSDVMEMQAYCVRQPEIPEKEVLPGVEHDEVILYLGVSWDFRLSLRSGSMRRLVRDTGTTHQVRRFEGTEASVNHVLSGSTVMLVDERQSNVVKFPAYFFQKIEDFWRYKVLLKLRGKGGYAVLYPNQTLRNVSFTDSQSGRPLEFLPAPDSLVYSWHAGVVVEISGKLTGQRMRVCVGGKVRSLAPLQSWGFNPRSLLYHCGALLVGSDSGDLHCFLVKTDADLLELDSLEPSWSLEVSDGPIVALGALAGDAPAFVVATHSEAFQVTLGLQAPSKDWVTSMCRSLVLEALP